MQIVVAKSERDPRWVHRNQSWVNVRRHSATYANADISKASSADKAEIERLLSNQTTVSSRIRRAFTEAVDRLADKVDIERIRTLLEQGRVSEAIGVVDAQLVSSGMQPIGAASTAATVWAGQQAALALSASFAPGEVQFHFGITNPETVRYLQNYEMALIRGLTAGALASVRLAIADGVAAGRNPLDVARDVRQFIGLTPSQTKAVLNYRRALESLDAGALQRQLRDRRFDGTISDAVDSGERLSPDYIDKLVERYRQRTLKFRSETIARTEAIRAVNAGNVQLWRQAVADGKVDADGVRKKWIYTHDSRVRHAHMTIPSLNEGGVGLNEPFKTELGPLMFPGDPNGTAANTIRCRCAMMIRYRAPAQRQDA